MRTYVGDNFEAEVLKSEKEFFVKYYAPWCDHCKVLAPIFQSVAEALSNNPNLVLAEFDSSKNDAIDV